MNTKDKLRDMRAQAARISLRVDVEDAQLKLEWLSAKLESFDVLLRLDPALVARLAEVAASGFGGADLVRISPVSTPVDSEIAIRVEPAGILEELMNALRDQGMEFSAEDARRLRLARDWERDLRNGSNAYGMPPQTASEFISALLKLPVG